MKTSDQVLDRIENADRMLRQARTEYQRGNAEDAGEFLAAARRNIDRAAEALKAKPVSLSEHLMSHAKKELSHAR